MDKAFLTNQEEQVLNQIEEAVGAVGLEFVLRALSSFAAEQAEIAGEEDRDRRASYRIMSGLLNTNAQIANKHSL